MKKIIAICGAKRSGKDLLAKHIINKYGYEKLSFAEPLKKIVKLIFNFNDIQVGLDECTNNNEGIEKDIIDDRWGITPRKALQFIGTEVLQNKIQELIPNIKKDYFANILLSKIKINKRYVITDLRFLHEYEKIKHLDILLIRIIRPSNINKDLHCSELEYMNLPCDFELINDGSIQDYINKFEEIIN
jgi:dephospho-CoA kinase